MGKRWGREGAWGAAEPDEVTFFALKTAEEFGTFFEEFIKRLRQNGIIIHPAIEEDFRGALRDAMKGGE